MAKSDEPVTIKKYANRRLYNTGTSSYVTLEDLASMVKAGEDFVVYDAKTGEDITRSVLAQIIFEQENKEGGKTCCRSTSCASSSASMATACRCWCRGSSKCRSSSLTREQEKFRKQMTQAFGIGSFGPLEEQVRRNMEMFERAFAMFTPFAKREAKTDNDKTAASGSGGGEEIDELKRQMEEMHKRLERLGKKE